MIALYGNVRMHTEYLIVFLQYFLPSMVVVTLLLNRNELFNYLLVGVDRFFTSVKKLADVSKFYLTQASLRLTQQEFVYFTKADDVSILNKVMIYVQENEITRKLKIVTVLADEDFVGEDFLRDLEVLDRAYPDIKIEFLQIRGSFGPEIINRLSKEWNIPINFMFISSPSDRFSHRVSDLGGVRLII